jgi:multicomponent Na+:H+ antiporter subunit E
VDTQGPADNIEPAMSSRFLIPRTLGIAAVLYGSWLLLSGKFDLMHMGVGAAVSLVVGWQAAQCRPRRVAIFLRWTTYVPWLFWQVVLSNLRVARLVFAPARTLRPRFVKVRPGTHGDGALALLGCSITLTPGTVSIDIDDRELLVHALDEESARSVEDGDMARRVDRLFEEQER